MRGLEQSDSVSPQPCNPVTDGPHVFAGRRVLLLQGPFGPFFRRFAQDLAGVGAIVSKINFNAGDQLFYRSDAIAYRGPMERWPRFLQQVLIARDIDVIVVFGDCRPIHRAAVEVARAQGVQVLVFEEGYVRPDYVTLETHGTNGHSMLSRDPDHYRRLGEAELDTPAPVGDWIWPAVVYGFFYYLVANLGGFLFPQYRHHRGFSLFEAIPWWIAFFRKPWYALAERGMLHEVVRDDAPAFYLVPLQVFNDYQVLVHSNEGGVPDFIRRVARSFAEHAPADARLVFKHHPMDRGYRTYSRLMRQVSRELGLEGRLLYMHDQHLPTLLRKARGLVTINSTVGMSALLHEVPVVTLGEAYYDIPGLTYQQSLDRFWGEAAETEVDMALFRAFRRAIVEQTQLNGNFYKPTPGSPNRSGLNWPVPRPAPNVIPFPRREASAAASGE